jgi:hypothetical protein
MVEDAAAVKGRIDSLGSIVHNPVVAERLDARGVGIVHGFGDVRRPTSPSRRTAQARRSTGRRRTPAWTSSIRRARSSPARNAPPAAS